MQLLIKFRSNDSPKFNEIIKNSEKIRGFSKDGTTYTINVSDKEIKNKKKVLKGIVSRIKDWEGTEFYIDNKIVSPFELDQVLQVLICESQNQQLPINGKACNQGEGWGCAQLNSVFYKSADDSALSMKNW